MFLEPLGRNWGTIVNWDGLGKIYAGILISWTVILYTGVVWLVWNRNLPFIRIRNVPIAVTSVSFLHVYLIKIMLAYTTNGHFPCWLEYWIMNIYLPFGIALFQANLVQLISISDQQKKFVSSGASVRSLSMNESRSLWQRWKALPSISKSYTYIGIAMFIQLVVTAAIYATDPVLQGDWHSFGHISFAKGQAKCRKSLVWIPSAFWQLAWSWCFGLWTLYKIRNIHDTHYWRLGTWLSVISGLPGTPLWIAALFCLKFKPVNIRWVPPMWLAPGIIVMQVVTIFFPMYEAWVSHQHMRKTLSLLKDWEEKGPQGPQPSLTSGTTEVPSTRGSTRSKEIFSMAALEKALVVNPLPLLHFAANKDFTAENIIFLMRVREWRQAYTTAPRLTSTSSLTSEAEKLLFGMALDIYMTCVHDSLAEFPINIEHTVKVPLDAVFGPAVPQSNRISGESGSSSPWDFDPTVLEKSQLQVDIQRFTLSRETSDDSIDTVWNTAAKTMKTKTSDVSLGDHDETTLCGSPATAFGNFGALDTSHVDIGPVVNGSVFDDAEASIKYLVLTNTWRKFAQEGYENSEKGMV